MPRRALTRRSYAAAPLNTFKFRPKAVADNVPSRMIAFLTSDVAAKRVKFLRSRKPRRDLDRRCRQKDRSFMSARWALAAIADKLLPEIDPFSSRRAHRPNMQKA